MKYLIEIPDARAAMSALREGAMRVREAADVYRKAQLPQAVTATEHEAEVLAALRVSIAKAEVAPSEPLATLVARAPSVTPIIMRGPDDGPEFRTNLQDARELVAEMDEIRGVMRELKAAFARSEATSAGGWGKAVEHPLYLQAEKRLAELHEEMMGMI